MSNIHYDSNHASDGVAESNRNRRQRSPEYSGLPQLSFGVESISTSARSDLQHPSLKDLALSLATVDWHCVSYYVAILEAMQAAGRRSSTMNLAVELVALEEARVQITNGIEGRAHFTESYLQSQDFTKCWKFMATIYAEPRSSVIKNLAFINPLQKLMRKHLIQLEKAILEADRHRVLKEGYKAALRARWLIISEIFDLHCFMSGIENTVPTWIDISAKLTYRDFTSSSWSRDTDRTSTFMWLTFIATVVVGLPTFAFGYQNSLHKPGTIHDADFWFLLQASSTTFLGLLTMGIPMWKGTMLSGQSWYWTWGAIGMAGICSSLSPIIYCYMPTEWASFLGIIAGAIQAFVALQITMIANGGKAFNKAKFM